MAKEWIDIHNHSVPFVDDGSKNWDMTRKMLRMSYNEGFRRIIVTPHYRNGAKNADPKELYTLVWNMQLLAQKIDPLFKIYLGNELYYTSEVGKLLDNRACQVMANSKYVLVEYPYDIDYTSIRNNLYQILSEGYNPIVAHVERYPNVTKKTANIEELIDMGAYIQVNANGVIGGGGFKVQRTIKKLMSRDLIHFVATDAHNLKDRTPKMKECAEFLKKKFGQDYVDRLLYYNPLMVINNKSI